MNQKNPWLSIPSLDYERHMSDPSVGQLEMLENIFREVLNDFEPKKICVLGCTTGNGFGYLINKDVELIVGLDINFNYLAECCAWYIQDIPHLNLVCGDLNEVEFKDSSFDLIHTALVFEYVDVERVVEKISCWLKENGVLTVVLQLPSPKHTPISKTEYESIKTLSSIMELVDAEKFIRICKLNNLICHNVFDIEMPQMKKFRCMHFSKE